MLVRTESPERGGVRRLTPAPKSYGQHRVTI